MPNELHKAAENNDLKTIQEILTANPNRIKELHSETKMLPIAYVALSGHLEAFKLFLDNGSPVDNVDFKKGILLMHFACAGGNMEIVKLLLNLGHKLDAKTATGHTAMHGAAFKGQHEIMEFLNKNGVPYNAKANDGMTPMFNAAMGNQVDTMKFLHRHGLSYDLLLTKKMERVIG